MSLLRDPIMKSVCAIAIELAIDLKEKMKKKKRMWVKSWIQRRSLQGASQNLINELRMEDPMNFKNFFRMNVLQFEELLTKVAPIIKKQDTMMRPSISPEVRLQVVLRYLATGDSFKSLEFLYRLPKCTISCMLVETLEAIYVVLQEYVKVPSSTEEWKKVINGFSLRWNFPGCIGALDGKHVLIRNPQDGGSDYYNYKGSYSIILLGLVDADYCFLYIDVGAQGRISDGGLLQDSLLYQYLEQNRLETPPGSVIVGDDAFPLKPFLMKPYSRRDMSLEERIFNYRLSRARNPSENAFGILVAKFRIFEKPIPLSPDKVTRVVKAAVALHNWLRKTSPTTYTPSGMIDIEDIETGQILPGSWRQIPSAMERLENQRSNNYGRQASAIRDSYANYFMTTGAVPWQMNSIRA